MTMRNVNAARNEIAAEYDKANTTHDSFPLGTRLGFAAAVLKAPKYQKLHNDVCNADDELDTAWTFAHPNRPAKYDKSITGSVSDATRRKREAARTDKIT